MTRRRNWTGAMNASNRAAVGGRLIDLNSRRSKVAARLAVAKLQNQDDEPEPRAELAEEPEKTIAEIIAGGNHAAGRAAALASAHGGGGDSASASGSAAAVRSRVEAEVVFAAEAAARAAKAEARAAELRRVRERVEEREQAAAELAAVRESERLESGYGRRAEVLHAHGGAETVLCEVVVASRPVLQEVI